MGCFNVACMLSKLTIHEGDKCYLVPLLPNVKENEDNIIPDSSYFLESNDFFNLFSLPISGYYDDYGSIVNIQKNKNTEAIEKFLNLTIEEFVECLTDGRRDYTDSYSAFCRIFFVNPRLFDDSISNDVFLESLGFKRKMDCFFHGDSFLVLKKDNQWTIKVKYKDVILKDDYNFKEKFLKLYHELTGNYLGLKNKKTYEIVKRLSAGFVLVDILDNIKLMNGCNSYELNARYFISHGFKVISDNLFEKNGHSIIIENGIGIGIDGKALDFHYCSDFEKYWRELTGDKLSTVMNPDIEYQIYEYETKMYLHNSEIIKNNEKMIQDGFGKLSDDILNMSDAVFFKKHVLGSILPMYKDIYKEYLLDVKKDWIKAYKIYSVCYRMNILLFPTFQGIQGGNNEGEYELAKVTYELAKKRMERN